MFNGYPRTVVPYAGFSQRIFRCVLRYPGSSSFFSSRSFVSVVPETVMGHTARSFLSAARASTASQEAIKKLGIPGMNVPQLSLAVQQGSAH